MATPATRMRLTIEVLPLAPENSHGPYQAAALAAFKGRKFALPVQLEDTFEDVWKQVEGRYKRNYLTPQQASTFTIHKLQDAYDCDLDLGDTVSSIFEGETDLQRRMIKVIPSFVYRDFSVPATSHLRPGNLQKRPRHDSNENANKRRRIEKIPEEYEGIEGEGVRDHPLPSTESEPSDRNIETQADEQVPQTEGSNPKSRSVTSIEFVQDAKTGHAEFGIQVKEESPELGLPLPRTISESGKSTPPSVGQREDESDHDHTNAIHESQRAIPGTAAAAETTEDFDRNSILAEDSQEAVIRQSPQSSPEVAESIVSHRPAGRRDIYEAPGSPDFTVPPKRVTTYRKQPRTPKTIQNSVDLLNSSRSKLGGSSGGQKTLSAKARSFQRQEQDEIVFTPQERAAISSRHSARKGSNAPSNASSILTDTIANEMANGGIYTPQQDHTPTSGGSSLKKPSKLAYTMVPPQSSNARVHKTPKRARRASGVSTSTRARGSITPALGSATSNQSVDNSLGDFFGVLSDPPETPQLQGSVRQPSPVVVIPTSSKRPRSNRTSSTAPPKRQPSILSQLRVAASAKKTSMASTASSEVGGESIRSSPSRATPTNNATVLPASNGQVTSNGTSSSNKVIREVRSTSSFKKPALKKGTAPPRASPIPNGIVKPTLEPSIRITTPIKSPVPLPENVRATSSIPRATPPRSEVPLPENVRHLSRTSSTPATSKKDVPASVPVSKQPQSSVPPKQGNQDDPLVLSSGSSSSDYSYSDFEDETEQAPNKPPNNSPPAETGINTISDPSEEQLGQVEQDEPNKSAPSDETRSQPDAGEDREPLSDDEAHIQRKIEGKPLETPQDRQSSPLDADAAATKPENEVKKSTWAEGSWGFESLDKPNNNDEKPNKAMTSPSKSKSRSNSPYGGTNEPESEAQDEAKSGSASAVESTRSSPATSRAARFLSHSPTPEKSSSEDESEPEPTPPRERSPKAQSAKNDSSSSSSSDSSSDSSGEDSDDEDVAMADADAAPQSSPPPTLPQLSRSQGLSASQPTRPTQTPSRAPQRVSQAPLPISSQVATPGSHAPLRSSQPQVNPIRRPTYQKFPSIRDQLTAARSAPSSSQTNKKFDPKMQSLGKLAKAKLQAKKGISLADDDSSSDESSSSSSSSEDEDEDAKGKKNGGFCSVA